MATLQSQTAIAILTSALLLASLLLGGSTRSDVYPLVCLTALFAVLVPLVVFSSGPSLLFKRPYTKSALVLLALAVSLPLVQLLSIPDPQVARLSVLAERSLSMVGGESTFRPISIDPSATLVSMLYVLGPLAVFMGVSASGRSSRLVLCGVIGLFGVVAALVGLLQIAQGSAGTLHWYTQTGSGTEATGFFANRNHFAALLYSLIVMTSAMLVYSVGTAVSANQQRIDWRWVLVIAGLMLITLLFLGATVMARSRAGLALTIAALVGIFLLSLSDRRAVAGAPVMAKILAGVVAIAVLFSSQFAMFRMLQRFEADPLEDARLSFADTTWNAIMGALPFGSGVGTFVPAFQAYEQPQVALLGLYANRAHNDFLEFALEGGVIAVALMVAFLIWFFVRAVAVWRKPTGKGSELDALLARAATIVICLLLAHAIVDYALRTPAMIAVFAFCCALLVPAPADDRPRGREPASEKVKVAHPRPKADRQPVAPSIDPAVIRSAINRPAPSFPDVGWMSADDQPASSATPSSSPPSPVGATGQARRWGEDIEWPSEWNKQDEPAAPKRPENPSKSDAPIFDWSKLDPKDPTKG